MLWRRYTERNNASNEMFYSVAFTEYLIFMSSYGWLHNYGTEAWEYHFGYHFKEISYVITS